MFRELVAKWSARRDQLGKLRASVDGAVLCDEVLADLDALARAGDDEVLNLTQAADESGYAAGHLGRLVRGGKIPNAGRPNAPKIRRCDLPCKPGVLRAERPAMNSGHATRGQIVRAVVNSDTGASDG